MFFGKSSPAQTYQRINLENTVEAADPHKLVVLLFEGAMAAVASAKTHLQEKHIAEKGMAISKAIDIIINGLHASLDRDAGGELAERLAALYDYMSNRLIQANVKNDPAILDEVSALLATLHGAWVEIGQAAKGGEPNAALP